MALPIVYALEFNARAELAAAEPLCTRTAEKS
jgi:hypothetical protein